MGKGGEEGGGEGREFRRGQTTRHQTELRGARRLRAGRERERTRVVKEEPREDVRPQGQLGLREASGCGVSAGSGRGARSEERGARNRTKHPTSNLRRERQLGFNRRKT